jgi:hypothetical protein
VCSTTVAYEDSFVELKTAVLDLDVASATIFPPTRFQPLVASNFLLAMAELVVVEQLDLHKAFLTLLSLSACLGQHSRVILMTKDDIAGSPWLVITTFARAHVQTQLWGIEVPGQCPLCGSTNSWLQKVAVMVVDKSHNVDSPDQTTVARYVYRCTYTNCGKRQHKPPHKFTIEKPPGFIINAARSKASCWFQSSPIIFLPHRLFCLWLLHLCLSALKASGQGLER